MQQYLLAIHVPLDLFRLCCCRYSTSPAHTCNTFSVPVPSLSTCVLTGKAVDMSEDHKPTDEAEISRIQRAGGCVGADGRVNGGLNLSRAIGSVPTQTAYR